MLLQSLPVLFGFQKPGVLQSVARMTKTGSQSQIVLQVAVEFPKQAEMRSITGLQLCSQFGRGSITP